MLFIVDTCQAASLYQKFYSPNVLAIGSSLVGEDSLSHHVDPAIGVYIIDRYTYYALEFLEHVTPTSNQTLGQFLKVCPKYLCLSTVGYRSDLFLRDPNKVFITDFFGSQKRIEMPAEPIKLPPPLAKETRYIQVCIEQQREFTMRRFTLQLAALGRAKANIALYRPHSTIMYSQFDFLTFSCSIQVHVFVWRDS